MTLKDELGLRNEFLEPAHEALVEVIVTATLLGKRADRVLRPLGLSEAQFNVLMLLRYQSAPRGLDQSSLGRMLVVNRANVTSLIDRMERDGLVSRCQDDGDRRVKRVRLSPAGSRALDSAEGPYIALVRDIASALSVAERDSLAKALGKLRFALKGSQN